MSMDRKLKKVLSILVIALMMTSSLSSFVYAESNEIILAKKELQKETASKIMPEVKEDMEREDIVEVLVYLKDQVDTTSVAETKRKAVSTEMTPYNTRLEVRRAVVEALWDKAESTQYDLLKYLKEEKEKGNVVEYNSYYIVNMVYVRAKAEVVENLSYRPEVEKIYKNKTHCLLDKEEKEQEKTEETEVSPETIDEVEWNIERIGANVVWDLGIDGTGAVVGLLDTGVDWTHPALKNKWRGYNSVNDEIVDPEKSWYDPIYETTLPEDTFENGTYAMGIIAGQEPDGSNKIGVAPGAKWIAARIIDEDGNINDYVILDAAQWMLAPGGDPDAAPDVIDNSWGYWNNESGIDDWFRDVVTAWINADIFPVFPAGDQQSGERLPQPGSIVIPANYPESFAVAATDKNDVRAYFSKVGPSPYDETLIKPEISAPGAYIRSSVPGGRYTGIYAGTEIAASHVAGAVALLRSLDQSLTVAEIKDILTRTTSPLTDEDYPESPNYGYGYGLVDVYAAVSEIISGIGEVEGKVLANGEDTDDAVIIHEQEITEAYIGTETEIETRVIDDVAVTEVELLVQPEGKSYWYLVPMKRVSGDNNDGIYRGTIASDMLTGDRIKYRIRARDYAGEAVITDDYTIEIKFGIVPGEYTQGFESYPVGWTFNGCWEYGEAVEGTDPEPYEGTGLAGTVIGDAYVINADDWLITPPIDLRDETLTAVSLIFHHWHDIERKYDNGYIYVTNDYGETWNLVGEPYKGVSDGWQEVVINLNDYIGSPNPVFVGFCFTSDDYSNNAGWYIDDVRLMGQDLEDNNEGFAIDELRKSSYVIGRKEVSIGSYETVSDEEVQNIPMSRGVGIPVEETTVTVLETGKTVKIDPTTGKYRIKLPEGTYTLRAEAYGYYPQDAVVTVAEDETVTQSFLLEGKPRGTIAGRVVDRYWGEPVSNAKIRIMEDKKISSVTADENGYFKIRDVLIGTYTLKVTAENFYSGEFTADVNANEVTEVEIGLKKFVGFLDEIAYDDGTMEDGVNLLAPGNGVAVRFTPEKLGLVKGVNIHLWGNSWPNPGGNRLGFVIYDIVDGVPVRIGEPIYVDGLIRGGWNYVDLSSFGFVTDSDFFISTIQDRNGDAVPGTGIDLESPYGDRSYVNIQDEFCLMSELGAAGSLMMRAVMQYSVDTPVITNLQEINYTNQDTITVEGTVITDAKVKVYVNGEIAISVESENSRFETEVELPLEENIVIVTAEVDGNETEPSPAVTVIKDKILPVLTVDEPKDNAKVNARVIEVTGNAADNTGIREVLINDEPVEIYEEGNFHERISVNEGENIITVKAIDLAGNETVEERRVYVEIVRPEITNIEPVEDLVLTVGDVLNVSFNAPTGGQGYFRLIIPTDMDLQNIGIQMTETEEGLYEGSWTVNRVIEAEGLQIEVIFIDQFGYRVSAIADGRVTIIGNVGYMEDLPYNTVIVGDKAFDIEYLNNNGETQMKLIEWVNSGKEVYVKLSEDTIVNLDGRIVSEEVLPERIYYYDRDGNIIIYFK